MRRAILLAGIPFVSAFLGATLAISLRLPPTVEAQATEVRSERVTVVGDHGTDRIRLGTGPGIAAHVQVLAPDGETWRVQLATGGPIVEGTLPEAAGLNIRSLDGTNVVRLGTAGVFGQPGTFVPGSNLVLFDGEGRARIVLRAAEDGPPYIAVLGEDGTPVWRAP